MKNKKPEIRFKGFSEEWEERELETVFSKIRNAFVGVATPYYVSEGHFYLESNNVKDGQINRNSEIFINDEFYEKQKDNWLHTGDIAMVQSGHVGHSAVIPPELNNTAAHALIIFAEPKEKINSYFLNYQFQTSQTKKGLRDITTGNTIKHILSSEMKKFNVFMSEYEEQNKIGNFFKNLDNLITLHQQKYEKLVNVKKAMLEKMFPKKGADVPEIRFKGFSGAWEEKTLSQIIDLRSGRDYKHLSNGSIPVYGTGGYMLSVNEALSYDEDAIGIGRKGTIDKPFLLKAPFWTVDTLFYAVPMEKNSLDFIYDIFQKINWKQKNEASGVPSLSKVAINGIQILIPNYIEQEKIGNYFKNLDKLLTLHQGELGKLKNLKKAMLEKMFI